MRVSEHPPSVPVRSHPTYAASDSPSAKVCRRFEKREPLLSRHPNLPWVFEHKESNLRRRAQIATVSGEAIKSRDAKYDAHRTNTQHAHHKIWLFECLKNGVSTYVQKGT